MQKKRFRLKRPRPAIRLSLALERVSRDRWLLPDDLQKISYALAKCASPSHPMQIMQNAYPQCCLCVGMIRGKPPFMPGDRKYMEVLYAVKKIKRYKKLVPEKMLLEIIMR